MIRYRAMLTHWAKAGPPVYMAVARYLGITQDAAPADNFKNMDDFANFLGAVPGGATGPRPYPTLEKASPPCPPLKPT